MKNPTLIPEGPKNVEPLIYSGGIMHYVTCVSYVGDYKLRVGFEDGCEKIVDLATHLAGEMFEPLKDMARFRTARLDPDVDTVVWENGADMSPDFLYEIGINSRDTATIKAAEPSPSYGKR